MPRKPAAKSSAAKSVAAPAMKESSELTHVIVNNSQAAITLPRFFMSESDEKAKRRPQKITLGPASNRGIIGKHAPEMQVTTYAMRKIFNHSGLRRLKEAGDIRLSRAGLDDLGLG